MRRAIAAAVVIAALGSPLVVAAFWWTSDPTASPVGSSWPSTVRVLAGSGSTGVRDGSGDRAQFVDPYGIAMGPDGLVYVADGSRIRVIGSGGDVATFAGGVNAGFADGNAATARFDTPSGLAFDAQGSLYVADTANNAIRRISPTGEVTTLAGGRAAGFADGDSREALFNGPIGIAVDREGRVLVADTYNDRIRLVERSGAVTTIAGSMRGDADGGARDARFDTPTGLAIDARGTLYVADTGNDRVRAIGPDGTVSTLLDSSRGVVRPLGVSAAPTGELYVTTEGGRLFERAANGALRVVAGSGTGFLDGPGEEARFRRPSGIGWQAPGRLIVADDGNAMVRSVEARTPFAPRDPVWSRKPRFDPKAFALLPLLWPLDPMTGPFEVAGTIGEARGEESSRFHAGIDVRADQGREVLAVRDGVVQAPLAVSGFGTLNESIRIGPLAYVHVRTGRDQRGHVINARFVPSFSDTGRLVDIRAKRGARFATGEVVGTINAFNHVHLNVGWPGEEYNPLLFRLTQFRDSIPPTIAAGGIHLFASDGTRITAPRKRRLPVSGDVTIVVDAWDQADGNQPNRRLGLFELGYQVLDPGGTPAPGFESPRITIRFDRLGDVQAPSLVFAPGSGIPFYGERRTRFLYVVTNTFREGHAAAGVWRTSELPAGDYTLRICARDASGNEAVTNRDLPITIRRQ
jgi:sugar lactone lactonase YvrE